MKTWRFSSNFVLFFRPSSCASIGIHVVYVPFFVNYPISRCPRTSYLSPSSCCPISCCLCPIVCYLCSSSNCLSQLMLSTSLLVLPTSFLVLPMSHFVLLMSLFVLPMSQFVCFSYKCITSTFNSGATVFGIANASYESQTMGLLNSPAREKKRKNKRQKFAWSKTDEMFCLLNPKITLQWQQQQRNVKA